MNIKNIKESIPFDLEWLIKNEALCGSLFPDLKIQLLDEKEIEDYLRVVYKKEEPKEVFALKKLFKDIILVAKNKEGLVFGYWQKDTNRLLDMPVVSYSDEEEFFEVSYGNLIQSVVVEHINEEEEAFADHKKVLLENGFDIGDLKGLIEAYKNQDFDIDDLHIQYLNEYSEGRDLNHLKIEITPQEYSEWRNPRLGTINPTKVESNVWKKCIVLKEESWQFHKEMDKTSSYDIGPQFRFDRFGKTLTRVNDKEIFIAGEHEDYYDPDFNIYNDVIVVNPDDSIDIYNYPKSVFPPTDFHTATLINENTIIIIGNLGYANDRINTKTPVFALDINTFEIREIETYGQNPGWIHKHDAAWNPIQKSITISNGILNDDKIGYKENLDEWQLDTESYQWKRLTNVQWKRWEMKRVDDQRINIWEMRNVLWYFENFQNSVEYLSKFKERKRKLDEEMKFEVDLTLLKELYRFDLPTAKCIEAQEFSDEYNTHRISIDGVVIRFNEKSYNIQVTVEGDLHLEVIKYVQEHLLEKLNHLTKSAFTILEY